MKQEPRDQCIWKGVATRTFSKPENYFKARKTTLALCYLACDGENYSCQYYYTYSDLQRMQEGVKG